LPFETGVEKSQTDRLSVYISNMHLSNWCKESCKLAGKSYSLSKFDTLTNLLDSLRNIPLLPQCSTSSFRLTARPIDLPFETGVEKRQTDRLTVYISNMRLSNWCKESCRLAGESYSLSKFDTLLHLLDLLRKDFLFCPNVLRAVSD
jgi:hypothetical protein